MEGAGHAVIGVLNKGAEMLTKPAGDEEADLIYGGIVVDGKSPRRRGRLILVGPNIGEDRHRRDWHVEGVGSKRVAIHLEFAAKGRELRPEAADVTRTARLPCLHRERRHRRRVTGGAQEDGARKKKPQGHRSGHPVRERVHHGRLTWSRRGCTSQPG